MELKETLSTNSSTPASCQRNSNKYHISTNQLSIISAPKPYKETSMGVI
jgi:hypothetical protein